MLNSYWEEQDMASTILDFHEKELSKTDLPKWVKDITCPFCQSQLPLRSFRNIRLCLNTRNMGDVAVEVLCDKCGKMDTVYFRERINNVSEFALLLVDENKKLKSEPVIEEKMFKMMYNNVVEKMVSQVQQVQKGEKNDAV